ncbi:MAG: hypothetical protein JNG84_04730 [Archangium sp.]|nr:hypothetical protein [Archangium sp.]
MSSFEERARARAGWPSEKTSADAQTEPFVLDATRAFQALAELTAQTWPAVTALQRAQWPSRLYRPGEPRPDSHDLFMER